MVYIIYDDYIQNKLDFHKMIMPSMSQVTLTVDRRKMWMLYKLYFPPPPVAVALNSLPPSG